MQIRRPLTDARETPMSGQTILWRRIDLPGHVSMSRGRWALNGTERPQAAGCVDVDLNFTPATNLIAIRRLALQVGDQSEAPAAWLRFPELALERLEQQYHRVALDRYDYQAPGVGYAATLQVSEIGFVTRYPGLWELEAVE